MEKNEALVSIIVPVYNVEKYLKKCIESIINQTYSNLEIILSDDGSTDNSPSICDEYAIKDSRIKVIHKANGGLSDARNAALNIISGKYVTFIDSDDYIEKEAIEILVNAMTKYNTLIVHMKSYIVSSDYKILENQSTGTMKVSLFTSEEYVMGMCEKRKSESVCDKLFNTSLFKNQRFEKGRLNEDFFFLSKLMFEDYQIAEIDYSGYNYYQRAGSITNSGYGKSLVDSVRNAYELKELAHVQAPRLEKYFARLTLFQTRTLFIVMPWKTVKNNEEEYKNSLLYLRKCIPYLKEVNLSKEDKLIVQFINIVPKLTKIVLGILWNIKMKIIKV